MTYCDRCRIFGRRCELVPPIQPVDTNQPQTCIYHCHCQSIQLQVSSFQLWYVYRVWQIKVIPCRVLLISQQRIGIFTRKFTLIFPIYIYV